MIIDDQTFTEIALHLRRASDGLLAAARRMSAACDPECPAPTDRDEIIAALESLVGANREFVNLEDLLRTIYEANRSSPHALQS